MRASPRGWVPPAPSPGSFDEKGALAPWGCWRRRAGRPTAWELPGAQSRDASIAGHKGALTASAGNPPPPPVATMCVVQTPPGMPRRTDFSKKCPHGIYEISEGWPPSRGQGRPYQIVCSFEKGSNLGKSMEIITKMQRGEG